MSLIQLPENIHEGQQLVKSTSSLNRSRSPKQNLSSSPMSVPLNIHTKEKIPVPESCKRKYYYQRCRTCNENRIRNETSFRCKDCPGKPPLCLLCFENHKDDSEN